MAAPLLALTLSAALTASPLASVLSPLVKVRPGQALPRGTPAANLHAARGECEGFQVLVGPGATSVRANPSTLHGSSELPLTLYREAYVPVTKPSNLDGATGLWPDPLLPLAVDGKPLAKVMPAPSTEERPLVLYAEICVPASASAGLYRGNVHLTASLGDGSPGSQDIPVTLTVEPFAIPATSSLPNSFGISQYTLVKGHHLTADTPESAALLRAYVQMMLEHRITAHGMSLEPPSVRRNGDALSFDFTAYDQELAPFMEGRAVESGARFTSLDLREHGKLHTDAERIQYYRALREHVRDKGWSVPFFYYAKDEPKPKDFAEVLHQSSRARAAGGVAVLVTAPLTAQLKDATDIFCPVLNCFFPRPGPPTCPAVHTVAELRRALPKGAHVWWYQSCMSHGCEHKPTDPLKLQQAFTGWASYMVDAPGTSNRAMGPLAALTGVDGELYFDVLAAYATQDPWADTYAFGGNGDGTFFYPGTREKLGTAKDLPIASLRLKTLRDGLEDYEYVKLLQEKGQSDFAREAVKGWVRSGYEITRDPASWEATRERIAAKLRASP